MCRWPRAACCVRRLTSGAASHRRGFPAFVAQHRGAAGSRPSGPGDGPDGTVGDVISAYPLPGTPVTDEELSALGFIPLELEFVDSPVILPLGTGCSWITTGEVPDTAGLYAFTVAVDGFMHVTYVGRTSHLWMVTKGQLPRSGGSRPGQRYGRPKYAGVTRQRINVLIAAQRAAGRQVRHWVRPLPDAETRLQEEQLIVRWRLRDTGWNRG